MSLGEDRVRVKFNPLNDDKINQLKTKLRSKRTER